MKVLKPNQQGFVTEIVVMLLILIVVLVVVFSRVKNAN